MGVHFLEHNIMSESPLSFLKKLQLNQDTTPYEKQLLYEIYNEALRFSFAYSIRKNELSEIENNYIQKKIKYCDILFDQKEYYNLLLHLICIVEDAETLTIRTHSDFIKQVVYFRDKLKALLVSREFESFKNEKSSHLDIFKS